MTEKFRGEGESTSESLRAAYREARKEGGAIVAELLQAVREIAASMPGKEESVIQGELRKNIRVREIYTRWDKAIARRQKAYGEWRRFRDTEGDQAVYEEDEEEDWENW
ncbi:MAG: hypothetical protein WC445_00475 [Patescibacteria group bacterium]